MNRWLFPHRLALTMLAGLTAVLASTPAHAQICAADRNDNGDASDVGETAMCDTMAGGGVQCPIERTACVADAVGDYACPLGTQFACDAATPGETPTCSPHACTAPGAAGGGVEHEPIVDDPGTPADGPVDTAGNCIGTIEIFSGRAVRCRTAGLATTFSNCCKDKGKIVKDGSGSSLSSAGATVAVAKGVFTGMKAAYTAFQAGATAAQAASTGARALVIGIDPTSLAISVAINLMIEVLLQGCDQQDMETAMLKGSGMCHEVGEYCASKILGICVQKARGQCCFNTKLGRIIQEQGRPQLKSFAGLGWGTPKQPFCRGFTAEEFQALDFSRMDLSEYYSEIEARAQGSIQFDMKERIDAYSRTMDR